MIYMGTAHYQIYALSGNLLFLMKYQNLKATSLVVGRKPSNQAVGGSANSLGSWGKGQVADNICRNVGM